MPRRQRFKPSRKPRPAIESNESEAIQPTKIASNETSQAQDVEDREAHIPR
jgi:hypothetical protein